MFHPDDRPMDRGWVGRIEGDRVVHLAAQTIQHFFTGGGGAREHAEYALAEVTLLVPILQPPTVRLFDDELTFGFGNPTAIVGPGASVPQVEPALSVNLRIAAVIGAEEKIGGFSALLEWRSSQAGAKANDFGLVLGPVVATDIDPAVAVSLRGGGYAKQATAGEFDWERACAVAARGTSLRTGDVLACPPLCALEGLDGGGVEAEVEHIGLLQTRLAAFP
jgi:fumarylacetoacetate (FAA) hydrolase